MLNVLIVYVLLSNVRADCDPNTGPAGGRECKLFEPYYSKYQWASCLTDKYIKTFSKGRHLCIDQTAVYCYYQCMIEIHNDGGSGPVFDDCACGRDAVQSDTTTLVTQPSIPAWCSSPSGDNCNWYRECLEKRYPCEAQGNSYALDFAEKFCKLYDDHYSSFDSVGQQWVNAVRKCLQVRLVPILRPFVHKTCDEIKQMAFDSHSDCYINPDKHAPSMCQIGLANTFRVFWTVKSSLLKEPTDSLKEMLCVGIGCNYITPSTIKGLLSNPKMTLLKIGIKIISNRLIYDFSEKLASQMKWPENGIMHFVYTLGCSHSDRTKRNADVESAKVVHILLASRSEYDLNAKNIPLANVTAAAIELADKIQSGDIGDLGNGTEISELNVCFNFNCTEKSRSVTPPPPSTVDTTEMQTKVELTERTSDIPTTFKVAKTDASLTTDYFSTSFDMSTEMSPNANHTNVNLKDASSSNLNLTTGMKQNNREAAASSNSHLSTASIVGIVFGVIFAVACLLLLIFCMVKRRATGSVV